MHEAMKKVLEIANDLRKQLGNVALEDIGTAYMDADEIIFAATKALAETAA